MLLKLTQPNGLSVGINVSLVMGVVQAERGCTIHLAKGTSYLPIPVKDEYDDLLERIDAAQTALADSIFMALANGDHLTVFQQRFADRVYRELLLPRITEGQDAFLKELMGAAEEPPAPPAKPRGKTKKPN